MIRSSVVLRAMEWLMLAKAAAIGDRVKWYEPNITRNEFDEVVFEWWNGDRKLTVYIPEFEVPNYVKVWGSASITVEMEDGEVTNIISLWKWLYS